MPFKLVFNAMLQEKPTNLRAVTVTLFCQLAFRYINSLELLAKDGTRGLSVYGMGNFFFFLTVLNVLVFSLTGILRK